MVAVLTNRLPKCGSAPRLGPRPMVAKEGLDLGVAAQQRVAELVTQRAKANVDELKALTARQRLAALDPMFAG